MKQFILHIIGFAVLLIGSYAGYYAYKMHKTKLPQADIYAWGDSRMYWGLNLELLEELKGKKVITTAQEGASVYDMLVFVDRVPANSICIIGYSECVLFRYHESDYNRSGCNWTALAQMGWKTNYTIKELYGIAKQNIWEPKQIATDPHEYFENADTVCTPEPWEGWYKMYKDTFPRFEAKGLCYEMAIRTLLNKQCTVILLDLPGYPEMERLAAEGSQNRRLSRELLLRLCEEFDLSQETIEIKNDSLLYYDLSHLNERGSKLLVEELQNHLDGTKFIQLKIKEREYDTF
jgi:hypothetical protein